MRDEEHGLARGGGLAPHAQQLEIHLVARHRVERAERLVHQEQGRVQQQRAADRRPLLHAAGQLARQPIGEAVEADQAEQVLRTLAITPTLESGQLGRQQDVVAHGAPPQEDGRLEHHAHGGNRSRHHAAVHLDGAVGRPTQPGHDAQERGLAATRRAHQRQQLAAADAEADVAQRLDRAGLGLVGHADPVEHDHFFGGSTFVRKSLVKTSSQPTLRGMSGI